MIFNEQGFIDIDEMIALALAEQAIAGDHQHLLLHHRSRLPSQAHISSARTAALRPTEPPSSVQSAEAS